MVSEGWIDGDALIYVLSIVTSNLTPFLLLLLLLLFPWFYLFNQVREIKGLGDTFDVSWSYDGAMLCSCFSSGALFILDCRS